MYSHMQEQQKNLLIIEEHHQSNQIIQNIIEITQSFSRKLLIQDHKKMRPMNLNDPWCNGWWLALKTLNPAI